MVVDPVGASIGAASLTIQLLDGCVKGECNKILMLDSFEGEQRNNQVLRLPVLYRGSWHAERSPLHENSVTNRISSSVRLV